MGNLVYLNGKLLKKEEASVSVFDHGFLYGDGVFEGIRAYNNRVFKLDEHIKRLYESAKIIMLEIPMTQAEFKKAIIMTCKENHLTDGYIRPVVTRGSGTLGLAPWKCANPNVIIIADKIQLYPEELYQNGMPIVTVATRRNISEALNPLIKSLNYLNNIMAKIEAKNANVEEALLLNQEGFVSECTGDNIFMIKDKVLYTPPIYAGALQGITRNAIIDLAKSEGIQTVEKMITRAELYISDEVFLTGTAAEAVPIIKIDGRVIGNGKPGEITKKLINLFKNYARNNGVLIE